MIVYRNFFAWFLAIEHDKRDIFSNKYCLSWAVRSRKYHNLEIFSKQAPTELFALSFCGRIFFIIFMTKKSTSGFIGYLKVLEVFSPISCKQLHQKRSIWPWNTKNTPIQHKLWFCCFRKFWPIFFFYQNVPLDK